MAYVILDLVLMMLDQVLSSVGGAAAVGGAGDVLTVVERGQSLLRLVAATAEGDST